MAVSVLTVSMTAMAQTGKGGLATTHFLKWLKGHTNGLLNQKKPRIMPTTDLFSLKATTN